MMSQSEIEELIVSECMKHLRGATVEEIKSLAGALRFPIYEMQRFAVSEYKKSKKIRAVPDIEKRLAVSDHIEETPNG